MLAWSADGLPSTRNWSFRWPLKLASPPQAPSDTQGNVSPQLMAVVMIFGRRVAPALWRLTFAALASWMPLIAGGSGLDVSRVLPRLPAARED
jgi:hypothetical protein